MAIGNVNPAKVRVTPLAVVYTGRSNVTSLLVEQHNGTKFVPLDLSAASVTRIQLIFPSVSPQILFDSQNTPAAFDQAQGAQGILVVDLDTFAIDPGSYVAQLVFFDAAHALGQVIVDGSDNRLQFNFRSVSASGTPPAPVTQWVTEAPTDGQTYGRQNAWWTPITSGNTTQGVANRITVTLAGTVYTVDIAATYAGQASITTLGTITAGIWNGSTIGTAYGGAGATLGILRANGAGTVSAALAGTDYVAPGAITGSALTMATARLLGRSTAGSGAVEEISVGANLTLVGGVLSASSSPALTVKDEGVDIDTAVAGINFVGTGVTVTPVSPGQVQVSIPGDAVTSVNSQTGAVVLDTDDVAEGVSNLYHTAARVLATVLSGLSLATGGAIVATDTVLAAFGKIQKQLNDHFGAGGTAHAAATPSVAGFMSGTDKTKLDGIEAGAQVNVATDIAQGTRTATTVPVTSSTGADATLDIATTSLAGVMSAADKTSLNDLVAGLLSASLTFLGTGRRILADLSNSTLANRLLFQSSTTDGATSVGVIPNGTGTVGGFNAFAASDPAAASLAQLTAIGATEVRLSSTRTGAASYLPMTFLTSDLERMRITTAGDVGVGTTSPVNGLEVAKSGTQADITATTYGVDGGGIIHGRMARGTLASPTAVLSGEIFAGVGGRAYHSGGAFQVSSPTSLHWVASENQTATAYGSYLRILTTPKGSTTRQERLLVTDNGVAWCHGAGTFDPRVETQSKPFPDNQFLASSSGASASYGTVCYGSGITAGYRGGASGGTAASPTATPADQLICYMGGHGYSAAGWSAGTKALLGFHAAESWTDTAQGTYITLQTTPIGSTTRAEALRVEPSGAVAMKIAAFNEAPIATVASAATTNIGAAASNTISISGTTTITSLGTIASGALRRLHFQGALTLTHNATSLILPTGANIATAAGDIAEFVSLGSGNWRCMGYQRADGKPLTNPSLTGASKVRVRNVATQSIPDNTVTNVLWDTEDYDVGGMHSTVTDTDQVVVNFTGEAVVTATIQFDTAATGRRGIRLTVNGTLYPGTNILVLPATGGGTGIQTTSVVSVVSGDVLRIAAFQDSGAALNLSGGVSGAFMVYRLNGQ